MPSMTLKEGQLEKRKEVHFKYVHLSICQSVNERGCIALVFDGFARALIKLSLTFN